MAELFRHWLANGTADRLAQRQRVEARARQDAGAGDAGRPPLSRPADQLSPLAAAAAALADRRVHRRGARARRDGRPGLGFAVDPANAPHAVRVSLSAAASRERLAAGAAGAGRTLADAARPPPRGDLAGLAAQGAIQIVDQIGRVLEADREPEQVRRDAEPARCASLNRSWVVVAGCVISDLASPRLFEIAIRRSRLSTAKARAWPPPVRNASRCRRRCHLAARERVLRVALEPRIEHPLDAGMRLEKARDRRARLRCARDPQRQRLQALQAAPRR